MTSPTPRFHLCSRLSSAAAFVMLAAVPALAQRGTSGVTIEGSVRDSARVPMADVEVVANPGNRRARTDSAGYFLLAGLDAGSYVITARKPGYARDRWDVSLKKSGRVTIKFVLAKAPDSLPAVTTTRDCSSLSFDGFACRRRQGGGFFLDRGEIDGLAVTYTADLFRGIPGFVVERVGARTVATLARRSACISPLIDGRPASRANLIPRSRRTSRHSRCT